MEDRKGVIAAPNDHPVIIDTPGFRSQTTVACIGLADFLLVPVKASPLDVDRMLGHPCAASRRGGTNAA